MQINLAAIKTDNLGRGFIGSALLGPGPALQDWALLASRLCAPSGAALAADYLEGEGGGVSYATACAGDRDRVRAYCGSSRHG
jgi:hypothetical protein